MASRRTWIGGAPCHPVDPPGASVYHHAVTPAPSIDPLPLAQALIRCPSVTPEDGGALDVLVGALQPLGFACHRLRFSESGTADVDNLYARLGIAPPHLCYAGHTDVVPTGDAEAWRTEPFAGEVVEDMLWGRGAADMKGAIACFVAAVAGYLGRHRGLPRGSVSLLITGDEEGPAINGTAKVLRWMAERDEVVDACLVGEPTNPERLGDMIKIGRRGSLNGCLRVRGTQGHVAYPQLADNPISRLLAMLAELTGRQLDEGSEHFHPSHLEVTTIDVGNAVANVIPAEASAAFNIRFNDRHTARDLSDWLRERCDAVGGDYELALSVSGEAFVTPPGVFSQTVADAVAEATGRRPAFSTAGGTSDARFIRNYCPVVEFGLVGQTMHKVNERVAVADLATLTDIYRAVIESFLAP